jgi:SOS response regulatory protein OraA/RecX
MESPERKKLSALDRVAWYLGRRDHSEKELATKLSRFCSKDEIEAALVQARERKWLAEPDVLAVKVMERLRRKRKSSSYIRAYLQKLGLPNPTLPMEDDVQAALDVLQRKFEASALLSWDDKGRAARYLVGRGFSMRVARAALDRLLTEQTR